ncbi:WYL domain-containing protein [Burkholderia contaminans]|uniref:helix-turn-helix transcriptional regulator n=1 Tax=Burkholderia contaminans TaxID=488447 RepID=UPI002416F122|nr:WYL domain-containing protein [Burkholderia contaminans]WFN10538.1 WYL domain-containing protein [Burkholderia contaminans]
MTSRSLPARLSRLDALAERLSDGAVHAIATLSEELGVSPRTLARDLALLREQGWELESSSGKGGGIRIAHRWPSGRMSLRGDDALELLMALALSEALGLSPTDRHTELRRQLARCFAPADRTYITQLRHRVRISSPVSIEVQGSLRNLTSVAHGGVYEAFAMQWMLSITYMNAENHCSERIIEPQCLLLAWPFWYVLAWDAEREAVRTFRMDRINEARRLERRFQLRPASMFWDACSDVGVVL